MGESKRNDREYRRIGGWKMKPINNLVIKFKSKKALQEFYNLIHENYTLKELGIEYLESK